MSDEDKEILQAAREYWWPHHDSRSRTTALAELDAGSEGKITLEFDDLAQIVASERACARAEAESARAQPAALDWTLLTNVPDHVRELRERAERAERDLLLARAAINHRVRHKKRGTTYRVIATGVLQAEGPLDNAPVTIYRADKDGAIWVRPTADFEDGRFEPIEPEKDVAP